MQYILTLCEAYFRLIDLKAQLQISYAKHENFKKLNEDYMALRSGTESLINLLSVSHRFDGYHINTYLERIKAIPFICSEANIKKLTGLLECLSDVLNKTNVMEYRVKYMDEYDATGDGCK